MEEVGYTHVLINVSTDSFYAVNPIIGDSDNLKKFVNAMHSVGKGVIFRWNPTCFAPEEEGMKSFDGTYLYGHLDDRKRYNLLFGYNFNYGREQVDNFLMSNANYFFDEFHADGLHIEEISTILYLDYGKNEGEWIPNMYGGNENLDAIEFLRSVNTVFHRKYPGIRLMVDNCYGEFVRDREPTDYGADVYVGSLIKNPGGGIAPTGGYVVGRKDDIERIASRLTAPGLGRELGSYEASYRPYYQGLFMAPHTVAQALKTAMLTARVFENLGYETTPPAMQQRADIIQAIKMLSPERLVAFCQGLQAASPVDSMAAPEPGDMPGYDDPVGMAAGTFVAGASIELSADGPMRYPYTAYMQGGLTFAHGKIALAEVLDRMAVRNCPNIDNA